MTKQRILITDVDSTVCDHWVRIRRHTLPHWPGDCIGSRAFTREEVLSDHILPKCKGVLDLLAEHGWRIRYLTARGWENAYKITVEQLSRFFLPNPNDVTIVKSMKEKLSALGHCDIYVDDFMTGQERNIGTFHRDVAEAIQSKGIYVVVFRNDWMDVLDQVERWSERQER